MRNTSVVVASCLLLMGESSKQSAHRAGQARSPADSPAPPLVPLALSSKANYVKNCGKESTKKPIFPQCLHTACHLGTSRAGERSAGPPQIQGAGAAGVQDREKPVTLSPGSIRIRRACAHMDKLPSFPQGLLLSDHYNCPRMLVPVCSQC